MSMVASLYTVIKDELAGTPQVFHETQCNSVWSEAIAQSDQSLFASTLVPPFVAVAAVAAAVVADAAGGLARLGEAIPSM
eukprot:5856357-Amphidinium_carterae.2